MALLALVALAVVPLRAAAKGGHACAGLSAAIAADSAGSVHHDSGHHAAGAPALPEAGPGEGAPPGGHGASDCATCLMHCIGLTQEAAAEWNLLVSKPSREPPRENGGDGLNPPPADPPPRHAGTA